MQAQEATGRRAGEAELDQVRHHVDIWSNTCGGAAMYCRPVVTIFSQIFGRLPRPLEDLLFTTPCLALSSIPIQCLRFYEVMTSYKDSAVRSLRLSTIVGDIYYYVVLGAAGLYTSLGTFAKHQVTFDMLFGANAIFRAVEMGLIYHKMQVTKKIEERLINLDLDRPNILAEFSDEELVEYFMIAPGDLAEMKQKAESLNSSQLYTNLFERFQASKEMNRWRMVAAAISCIAGLCLAAAYFCPVTAPVAAALHIAVQTGLIGGIVLNVGIWASTYRVESRSIDFKRQ